VFCYVLTADPSAKQSYSRITDEQPRRASHAVQRVSDGSPMRNGNGEGDDSRPGSACKWKDATQCSTNCYTTEE